MLSKYKVYFIFLVLLVLGVTPVAARPNHTNIVIGADDITIIDDGTNKPNPNALLFYGSAISQQSGKLSSYATIGGNDNQAEVNLVSGGNQINESSLYLQAIGDSGTAEIELTSTTAGDLYVSVTGDTTFFDDARVNESFFGLGSFVDFEIAGDAVTLTQSIVRLDTEGLAATDNLCNVYGGESGDIVVISSVHASRDITLLDSCGNLRMGGNFTLTSSQDTITFINRSGTWIEQSRSDNG